MRVYDGQVDDESGPGRRAVGIAEYVVTTDETVLTSSGLGSCVGVAVYDRDHRVGGLVHVMLPEADGDGTPAKYADAGVRELVAAIERSGGRRANLAAKLAGGSDMLDLSSDGGTIGSRNVRTVRDALADLDVPVAAADVGGNHGRSVAFDPATRELRVTGPDRESTVL